MSVLKNKKLNTQKGFTLVELIVVLVLMMIFITLGVAGILTWQDWSRFKKENTAAETIFYSLQNQFTELDATDAFDSKVKKPVKALKDSSDKEILFVANRICTCIVVKGQIKIPDRTCIHLIVITFFIHKYTPIGICIARQLSD